MKTPELLLPGEGATTFSAKPVSSSGRYYLFEIRLLGSQLRQNTSRYRSPGQMIEKNQQIVPANYNEVSELKMAFDHNNVLALKIDIIGKRSR